MEFGVFDHVDRPGPNVPLRQFFEERIQIAQAYERFGFFCYHIAEHHFTPLGMAASPGIFLSSVAQRTKTLRFGPLVYILPFYHPLRLAEEICMLDHLSGGRLELGIGRGISPIEASYYGESTDFAVSRQTFAETWAIMQDSFSKTRVTFEGRYRQARDIPIELDTLQKPHPPLWMGVSSVENAEQAARGSMNFVAIQPPAEMRKRVERYKEAANQNGGLKPSIKMGMNVFVVVGETDAEAQKLADRAYRVWHRSFHYLYHLHGRSPVHGERADNFQDVERCQLGVAGSPQTVIDVLSSRIAEAGNNYLMCQLVFGDMKLPEALHSIGLFAREVMPALRASAKAPAMA
jgi:alkanesulfonate monooxygenase SsuD/methylene tetrahydromethanopterin reductase-like flavin-dependent oxidoreductase (luciferase family)